MKQYNNGEKRQKSIAAVTLRGQTLHLGHILKLIINAMMKHDLVYVYFGSSDAKLSMDNPFTIAQRITMLKILLGTNSKIKIIALRDIGASTKLEWVTYMANETKKQNLEQPTFYYAGDEINAKWMTGVVNPISNKPYTVILIDRLATGIMSGTDIRKSILNNGEAWKIHVPEVLHDYILEHFPFEELKKLNPNMIIED